MVLEPGQPGHAQRGIDVGQDLPDTPALAAAAGDVQDFQAARTSISASSASQQKYSGYPGINYFSDVYFNPARSAALVYMVAWCTSFCSQGEWVYLEKQDSKWVRRSGQASVVSGAKPF